MHTAAALLSLAVLVRIGLLPRTDFRPGRRTLAWWLNALPFWLAGTGLVAVLLGVASPWGGEGGRGVAVRLVMACVAAVSAFWLIGRTSAAHERRPALWHQPNDVPDRLVTTGPYARIRHPFYAAFLVALSGCVLAAPHVSTALAFALGAYRLNVTAAAEEARFRASEMGGRYASYALRTGRFLPRLRRPSPRRSATGP